MSVSCVGTCSNCGVKRFWLSDMMSLQLDDGRLKCLRHPAERSDCQQEGLTLAQASERGRLYRETFYVCRNCGREGEIIQKQFAKDIEPITFPIGGATKWAWGSAAVVVPFLAWMRWWDALVTIGGTLVIAPAVFWWDNRKSINEFAKRGLPRADAPGRLPIPEPMAGCSDDTVIGQRTTDGTGRILATGPCCDAPDWIEGFRVTDEDKIPCCACGKGVMVISEHAIH